MPSQVCNRCSPMLVPVPYLIISKLRNQSRILEKTFVAPNSGHQLGPCPTFPTVSTTHHTRAYSDNLWFQVASTRRHCIMSLFVAIHPRYHAPGMKARQRRVGKKAPKSPLSKVAAGDGTVSDADHSHESWVRSSVILIGAITTFVLDKGIFARNNYFRK
ncbi:uncharacterized protein K460DRAFT_47609 [Cucurbitaria berberidis CBS 394.84]|uniref:Uncharacterized protein n=1 Tax=Cucurbitaria berberidis CBS 394.84 TaxID=1168544 RepID=A0A9P4GW76_9PLEO|nr:uncharacterized protein K460DRAFT_47609 [Cucurbitaria berberidis CBS 394.84]KAF1852146.1 hypothetical protein K460DRAFT_47609 [Cucurbitaria berberidis CBS 394.84]